MSQIHNLNKKRKEKVIDQKGIDEKMYEVGCSIGGAIKSIVGVNPKDLKDDTSMYELVDGSQVMLRKIILSSLATYYERQLTNKESEEVPYNVLEVFETAGDVFDFVMEHTPPLEQKVEIDKKPNVKSIEYFKK